MSEIISFECQVISLLTEIRDELDEKWGKIKIFRGGDYIRYSYI